jgi:hypothetical protein
MKTKPIFKNCGNWCRVCKTCGSKVNYWSKRTWAEQDNENKSGCRFCEPRKKYVKANKKLQPIVSLSVINKYVVSSTTSSLVDNTELIKQRAKLLFDKLDEERLKIDCDDQ